MTAASVRRVVCRLGPDRLATDADLVAAIAGADREAAFAELVGRYAPMVLGACQRLLGDVHEAEDAFQAVFLVLARRAGSIRPPGAVGGWLYGVAVRTARKAKTAAARRRRREMTATAASNPAAEVGADLQRAELRAAIDAELAALPGPHRAAVVLCDLHGKTRAEAAHELSCPEGTVAAWLARGRKALAGRLARRGVSLPAVGLVAVLAPPAVSAELQSSAHAVLSGRVSEPVLSLAEAVMRTLSSAPTKLVVALVMIGALVAGVASAMAWPAGDEPKPPAPPTGVPAPVKQPELASKGFVEHKGSVYSVGFAPEGKTFLSVGGGAAVVWEANTRKKLFAADAEFAAFSGDGKALFVLVKDEFRTLDAATGKVLVTEPRDAPKALRPGRVAAFSFNGKQRVEFDGVRHHPRGEKGDRMGDPPTLAGQGDSADQSDVGFGRGAAFHPDVATFAGIHTGALSIWNPRGARIGTISRGPNNPVRCFAWAPGHDPHSDHLELAVGYDDSVRVYTAANVTEGRRFYLSGATALAWSADRKTLAVAVGKNDGGWDDSRVVLLDAQTGKELRRFDGFPEGVPVVSLAFSPGGKQIVCGSGYFPGDGPPKGTPDPLKDAIALRVLNLDNPPAPAPVPSPAPALTWKETAVRGAFVGPVNDVAVAPDGKTFALVTDSHLYVLDAAKRETLWFHETAGGFRAVAFSGSGLVAAAGPKASVLLDAKTGKAAPLNAPDVPVVPLPTGHAIAFDPESARVAVSDGHATEVRYLPPTVGTVAMEGPPEVKKRAGELPAGVAFSPDGKRLALIRHEKQKDKWPLLVWGAGSGEPMKLFAGHANPVTAVAWAADGKVLATGSSGVGAEEGDRSSGELALWDAATGKELYRLSFRGRTGGESRVNAVAISPDGATVAVAVRLGSGKSVDRVILVSAATGKEIGVAFPGDQGAVTGLAFAPDGTRLYGSTGALAGEPRDKPGAVTVWERKP